MGRGIDCSTPLTRQTCAAFMQDTSFVGRYLVPTGWKRLTPEEAQLIYLSGMYIVSVFELTANRVKGGEAAGTQDGKSARECAINVGQPEGSTIYFAVDYDAQPDDYDVIEAYLRAADREIHGYEVGVYGSYDVVKEMFRRGVTAKLWQTYAWSKGRRLAEACIYQYENDVFKNGIQVDHNVSNGDAGGWRKGMAIEQRKTIDPVDGEQIVDIIKWYWNQMDGNKDVQDYAHHLAGVVREAAGLPPEQ